MIHFRNLQNFAVILLVGAAILGAPTRARAAFAVKVFEDGSLVSGGSVLVSDAQDLSYLFKTTNSSLKYFQVTSGVGNSNNPGDQTFGSSLELTNLTRITTNFGSGGGTHTISIQLSEDYWYAPVGNPLNLSSSAGGSYAATKAGNTVAATYQGFLDNTNTLFGQPGTGATPLQTSSVTSTAAGITYAMVYDPATAENNYVPGGTPFSITDVLTVSFTLVAGSGQEAVNGGFSTIATVPAPAAVALAFTGLPILGIGAWWRRRQARLTAV